MISAWSHGHEPGALHRPQLLDRARRASSRTQASSMRRPTRCTPIGRPSWLAVPSIGAAAAQDRRDWRYDVIERLTTDKDGLSLK
ncbi:MAG TPA: hypothetical protein VF516_30020 [Kofleriaceae bacterium]